MKYSVSISAIPSLTALLLLSCDSSSPEITFETSFPKPHKDLTAVLGEEFLVRHGRDTIRYRLSSSQEAALITEAGSGDTIFWGKVSRYRGVYYFSQANKDNSYGMYAVRIQDKRIYGLNSGGEQSYLMARQIRQGKHQNLVSYVARDSSQIRLRADKKQLRELFTTVLPQIAPETLVTTSTAMPAARFLAPTSSRPDPAESAFLLSVYPNPVKDVLHLALRDSYPVAYHLTDLQGKHLLQGQVQGNKLHINLQHLRSGIYALTLTLTDHQREERETLRIIKQ